MPRQAVVPPSITTHVPVIIAASSLARKTTSAATSSGRAEPRDQVRPEQLLLDHPHLLRGERRVGEYFSTIGVSVLPGA